MSTSPKSPDPDYSPNPDTFFDGIPVEVFRVKFTPWPAGKPEPPSIGRPPNPWLQNAGEAENPNEECSPPEEPKQ